MALKSDEQGRIALGALPGIASVQAKAPNGREANWQLDEAERTWSSEVHAAAGERGARAVAGRRLAQTRRRGPTPSFPC